MNSATVPAQPVSCCSAFYEQDWVRHLAGDIFHPGGPELTQKTIATMELHPGASIADLGCGTGTSALMLAADPGLNISAIDLSHLRSCSMEIKKGRDFEVSACIRVSG